MVPELTGLRPHGRILGVGMAMPGPFDVESMSFVGPTTMAGWKDVQLRERLAEATGLPAFLETDMVAAALGEQLHGLGTQFSDYYYLYFGIGLGGAMVHDGAVYRGALGQCRRNRPHPGGARRRGLSLRQPGLPRTLPVARGVRAPQAERGRLDARRRTDLPQCDRDHREPLRSADDHPRRTGDDQPARTPGQLCRKPSEFGLGARGRTAPRILVGRGGQNSVLRGAAALAISGVLSPRFGQMFTADRAADPVRRKGIAA